jgi:hypothetical protein
MSIDNRHHYTHFTFQKIKNHRRSQKSFTIASLKPRPRLPRHKPILWTNTDSNSTLKTASRASLFIKMHNSFKEQRLARNKSETQPKLELSYLSRRTKT